MKSTHHKYLLIAFFAFALSTFVSCGKTEFTNSNKDNAKLKSGEGDATGENGGDSDAKGKSQIDVLAPGNPIVGSACNGDDVAGQSCANECDGDLINGICYSSMYAQACAKHGEAGHICSKEECGHEHGPYCGGECKDGNCGGACQDGCNNADGSIDYIVNFHSGKLTHSKLDISFGNEGVSEEIVLEEKKLIQNWDEKIIVNYDKQEDIFTYACYCNGWGGYYQALNKKPFAETISVTIDGNTSTDWEYIAASNKIKFLTKLTAKAVIKISYSVDAPLSKSYTLQLVGDRTLLTDTLNAKLNGAVVEIASYDAANKIITISQSPTINGSEVQISYQTEEITGAELAYKLNFSDGSVNNLKVIDKNTNAEIGHSYENGVLSIVESDWAKGKVIIASYVKAASEDGYIELNGAPYGDSLSVKGVAEDGSEEECPSDKIEVKDNSIKLQCDLPSAVKLVIEYDYVTGLLSEFTLEGIANPDQAVWTVMIGGRLVVDYTREGSKIILASPAPHGVAIMIKAHVSK